MEGPPNPFLNRRVAFAGKLGGMNLREAATLVRRLGGIPVDRNDPQLDLIVLGAEQFPSEATPLASISPHQPTLLEETELWRALGLLEENSAGQLFTPALLGELLEIPVATIRRWHRMGFIQPRHVVHRLPYFSFEEVAVARRLADLLANGATLETIEARLRDLARHWPQVARPLAELSLSMEGGKLLVKRHGEIIESSGQKRLGFEDAASSEDLEHSTLALPAAQFHSAPHTPAQLLAWAEERDDAGDDLAAADLYRAALAAGGPNAAICFQLAECLYRLGELAAARERYCMALELDDRSLEARANLGCVLAELGQNELAIAAFQGVLALQEQHADAHYHLAQLFSANGEAAQAREHRQQFEQLMPSSPWSIPESDLPT